MKLISLNNGRTSSLQTVLLVFTRDYSIDLSQREVFMFCFFFVKSKEEKGKGRRSRTDEIGLHEKIDFFYVKHCESDF